MCMNPTSFLASPFLFFQFLCFSSTVHMCGCNSSVREDTNNAGETHSWIEIAIPVPCHVKAVYLLIHLNIHYFANLSAKFYFDKPMDSGFLQKIALFVTGEHYNYISEQTDIFVTDWPRGRKHHWPKDVWGWGYCCLVLLLQSLSHSG